MNDSTEQPVVTPRNAFIVNPGSGERIRIRPPAADEERDVLVWDLWLAPGGSVPSGHVHPGQTETFHVQHGRLRFRLGLLRRVTVRAGESLSVPAGRPHHFAAVGDTEVHAVVETAPAMAMEDLLRVAAGLAGDDHGRRRRLPRPVDLLLFMDDFRAEVRAPYLPAALVRAFVAPGVRVLRLLGLDSHYRRLRSSDRPVAASTWENASR